MTANSLTGSQSNKYTFDSENKRLDLDIAQERIYNYFIGIVKTWKPEDVLQEFKRLFLGFFEAVNSDSTTGIYELFSKSEEQAFLHTLKRCCYILINNWESNRKHKYIQDLVNLFSSYKDFQPTKYTHKNLYIKWISNFIDSEEYQHIQFFAFKNSDEQSQKNWMNRYSSYLLVAQSLDINNPKEQQEAAIKLSRQLKDKFKFELAMYIARSQSSTSSTSRYKNPSILGDNVLRLIKAIVVKKGMFSYENIANIFLQQTQNQTFEGFKDSLQKYLIFSVQQQNFVETLKTQLLEKLHPWKAEQHEEMINKDLVLRTCNKVIDYLTTENGKEPSSLFILLLSQGHSLTLVIVLLKIILVSKNSRIHLESRIAYLIRYYNKYPEDECKWLIHFIEIFNITFAIYAENVEYNLIKIKEDEPLAEVQLNLDDYHVFSQLKTKGI
ncbi:hypothetical protein WA1_28405 [Scytonema hofmannii PCC 7110]|uniref:Uncharacterized protein n=1 Tax=Scytonema hofmannii PCC 7110 TaxID=128403 RepID=A0A139X5D8_9CYAN|nr:hypothetical protein [Scytonema hofmannii]KYC39894.1 hypothetical protein WA1_28405 [Scytonema hofmannii PCC 7110]